MSYFTKMKAEDPKRYRYLEHKARSQALIEPHQDLAALDNSPLHQWLRAWAEVEAANMDAVGINTVTPVSSVATSANRRRRRYL